MLSIRWFIVVGSLLSFSPLVSQNEPAAPVEATPAPTQDETFPLLPDSLSDGTLYRIPALGLSVPDPFRKGYLGVVGGGLFLQQRTRITNRFYSPDGNALFSVGLGDPEKWVGLEVWVNIYGLANNKGAPGNFGEGTLDVHFSRNLKNGFWVGAGVFDLLGWKPEPPNKLTSYYVVAMKTFKLRSYGTFFKSIYLTVGSGNGKFRRDADYNILSQNPWDFYGSVAVQVLPAGNFIAEWNGFNAFSGLSILPFKKLPFQLLVGVDDIFHENKKIVISGSMGLYLNKKPNKPRFYKYSLVTPPPPQTSRIL